MGSNEPNQDASWLYVGFDCRNDVNPLLASVRADYVVENLSYMASPQI